MFDHTMERAAGIVGPQRVISVIGNGHWRYLDGRSGNAPRGFLVEQPQSRGTAPGIFLPLSYVLAFDPDATVTIFPSDHFIRPNGLFADLMLRAARLAELRPDRLVLAAAIADRPEPEFGWIQQGEKVPEDEDVRAVAQFREKPDLRKAVQFYERGFLWNTMIMAAKARTLWAMGRAFYPAMMERFASLMAAVGTPEEARTLASIYEPMESVDFSKQILERAAERTLVLPMRGIEWSDWGLPERIEETLRSLGGLSDRLAAQALASTQIYSSAG